MKRSLGHYARSQEGYTLLEVVIASAIGAIVMTALTSVILTSVNAGNTATSRIEASGQIRNFEFFAYDDFAHSGVPKPTGCGTVDNQCSRQALVLSGAQVDNSLAPVGTQVSYTWDGSSLLDRQAGADPSTATHILAATNVTGFFWYVDGQNPNQTVVVNLTVKVQSYIESQTLRFHPRVNPP
jgi:prepilin-type N-terminal cleavage/methylation domain-containing protein